MITMKRGTAKTAILVLMVSMLLMNLKTMKIPFVAGWMTIHPSSSSSWRRQRGEWPSWLSSSSTHTVTRLGMVAKVPEAMRDSDSEELRTTNEKTSPVPVPSFLERVFNTECDNTNRPPSLNIILRSIEQLATSSGSDIRGTYVSHARLGSIASVAHDIGRHALGNNVQQPPLTPLAAYCFGHAFARYLIEEKDHEDVEDGDGEKEKVVRLVIGKDPRSHGMCLADSFARGAQSAVDASRIEVLYTGITTTPACASFCMPSSSLQCDGSVMVTASHLPADRNGFKFFAKRAGGAFTKGHILKLKTCAMDCAMEWYNRGILPPSSGTSAVMCSRYVDYMPSYAQSLKQAILRQIRDDKVTNEEHQDQQPLKGLKILVNAGHGAGGFFASVLSDLGADTSSSIGLEPDSNFPLGVPNPEYKPTIDATTMACCEHSVDLGIMFDTDADRCAFVVPTRQSSTADASSSVVYYAPLNRNRLIALLGVVFAESSPGCAIVTDSVTSEGLSVFLEEHLGLKHVRYLRGYANVINRAIDLTNTGRCDAQVAIETSGHCALRENNYLDDGTYTAVKVVSLLASENSKINKNTADDPGQRPFVSLLDLISPMDECDEVKEFRLRVEDSSLETTKQVFDLCALAIEQQASGSTGTTKVETTWNVDADNLEGIRLRFGDKETGQFFMLRRSLHDPVMSLQVEGRSKRDVCTQVIQPLLELFQQEERIMDTVNLDPLNEYLR